MKAHVGSGLAIVLFLGFAGGASCCGQDVGLFNGNGISNQWGTAQSDSKFDSNVVGQNARNVLGAGRKSDGGSANPWWKLPKLDVSKIKPKFQKPEFLQDQKFPKPFEFSDSPGKGFMSSLPQMKWPARDASQPTFFQRLNDRTSEMFGKTRDGFSRLGQQSKNTWESMTRGWGDNDGLFGGGSDTPPPVQPKSRSARQASGSTSKFNP